MSSLNDFAARVEDAELRHAVALRLCYAVYRAGGESLDHASESERATLTAADNAWRDYDALCGEYLRAFKVAHPWSPGQTPEQIVAAYPPQLRAYLGRHRPVHGIWAVL